MTELQQIASAWHEASGSGESGVLATVVRVQGSTYRRPGARLLLTSGGRRVGSVSGGCLEADLSRKAWWLTENFASVVREYDTRIDGELGEGFGLGCQGIIHVLVERLGAPGPSVFDPLAAVAALREPALLATVIDAGPGSGLAVGQRWMKLPSGESRSNLSAPPSLPFLEAAASAAVPWADFSPAHEPFQDAEFLIEPVFPGHRLLLFGAGDDAIPMARLAKLIGCDVIVLDGRSHFARPERFPMADRVLTVDSHNMLAGIIPDRWTSAILMSHSYAQDAAALAAISLHPVPYIGVLGPRRRTESLLAGLPSIPAWLLDALHSPMGLDIGAEGGEQIALAAMAELRAALSRREGRRLREKAGPMEARHDFFSSLSCPLG